MFFTEQIHCGCCITMTVQGLWLSIFKKDFCKKIHISALKRDSLYRTDTLCLLYKCIKYNSCSYKFDRVPAVPISGIIPHFSRFIDFFKKEAGAMLLFCIWWEPPSHEKGFQWRTRIKKEKSISELNELKCCATCKEHPIAEKYALLLCIQGRMLFK